MLPAALPPLFCALMQAQPHDFDFFGPPQIWIWYPMLFPPVIPRIGPCNQNLNYTVVVIPTASKLPQDSTTYLAGISPYQIAEIQREMLNKSLIPHHLLPGMM
jgi:hypothetical protein